MSDFRELNLPQKGHKGWYIATKEGDTAWLTINGNISGDTGDMDILFYENEFEAHEAAIEYYAGYLQSYPYVVHAGALVKKNDIVESQVMEFI